MSVMAVFSVVTFYASSLVIEHQNVIFIFFAKLCSHKKPTDLQFSAFIEII